MEHAINGTTEVQLNERLVLHPLRSMHGNARTLSDGDVVLGGTGGSADDPLPVLHQQGFSEAQAPIALTLAPPTPSGIPGMPVAQAQDQMAMLEFTPDTEEAACYALVQAIHTPDGVVYDVTLPLPTPDDATLPFDVLGGTAGALQFPIHRLVTDTTSPATDEAVDFDVLGGGLAATTERILHLVRAPIESNLHALIQRNEVPFRVWHVAPDATLLGTLDDANAWRGLFPEPRPYRVLLYVHGFTSRSERSMPRNWIQALGGNYEAILAYDHPSITLSPLDNARALLGFIPADLRLQVDILAHSRGGLVTRSIVELEPALERLQVQRAMLVGTPNAGTEIADVDRWDRFLAMGFTTASWLAGLAGGGVVSSFSINGLGLVLRASAQLVFDLPGLEAMSPTSQFLSQLNAPSNAARGTRYAAVTADFNPLTISKASFREALQSLAIQLFLEAPNDLVVRTDSMVSVDAPRSVLLAERILQSTVHHHAYFDDPDVFAYARSFFTG